MGGRDVDRRLVVTTRAVPKSLVSDHGSGKAVGVHGCVDGRNRMESAQFGPDHVIEIRNGRYFQSPELVAMVCFALGSGLARETVECARWMFGFVAVVNAEKT